MSDLNYNRIITKAVDSTLIMKQEEINYNQSLDYKVSKWYPRER